MAFITIYITHKTEKEAQQIANHLIAEKLVACANLFPISSSYWWKGTIEEESEWVSLVKTTEEYWTRVMLAVEKLHPYDVPCIMKSKVEANNAYEEWIRSSLKK